QLDTGEQATVTDATGAYSFTGLSAGTYTVREIVADGWKQTGSTSAITVTLSPNASSFLAYIGNLGVTNTVVVDGAWLQKQGRGPYLPPQATPPSVLATDFPVDGTGFVALAANVVLDLNSHTVTYGNRTPLQLANGGFEEGSSPTDVPGWNLSGAPGAVRLSA